MRTYCSWVRRFSALEEVIPAAKRPTAGYGPDAGWEPRLPEQIEKVPMLGDVMVGWE